MKKKSLSLLTSIIFLIVALNSGIAFGAPKKATKVVTKPKAATKVSPKKQQTAKTKPAAKVETKAQIEAELKALVEKNIDASNKRDVNEYMSTIFNQNPIYSQTQQMITQIFGAYKLDFKLIDYKILNIVGDTATVSITTETRKISGPDFKDNKTVVNNLMKKQNGAWKFYSSSLVSAELLQPTTTGSAIDTTTDSAITTDSGIK